MKEKTIEQHLHLAQKKQSQGKLDEAIDIYRQIIQLFPFNHQPYNHLGKALVQQGNLEQAIAIFQQGIELQPNFPSKQGNLQAAVKLHGYPAGIGHKIEIWLNHQQLLQPIILNALN